MTLTLILVKSSYFLAAVLFIPPDERPDSAIERLIALVRPLDAHGYLVGVGRVAESLGAVRTAYLQAQAALRTLLSGAEGVTVMRFDDIVRDRTTLPDIHEREIYLMLALDQGDLELAGQIFREVLASANRCALPTMHYTCIRLLERIMRGTADIEGLDAEGFAHEMMDKINASMMEPFESGMLHAIKAICRKNKAHNTQKDDIQKNEVIAFVLEHYDDNALSLEYLSARFGFSSYYWSRYFKESVGQNFSEYVWKLRLARAKELLASPLSVAEVVERVGYLDVRSFIRKFKNSEGVTPAQYKRDRTGWPKA
ncbi:MAG TPA: helix-turn-helix domain-containing protein [Clostridia bacterium]|nr:helix-turn-helix domain-containing protein [Clostridia bacterium]